MPLRMQKPKPQQVVRSLWFVLAEMPKTGNRSCCHRLNTHWPLKKTPELVRLVLTRTPSLSPTHLAHHHPFRAWNMNPLGHIHYSVLEQTKETVSKRIYMVKLSLKQDVKCLHL